jgi:hypothetical protein
MTKIVMTKLTSYVLVDGDWHYLNHTDGDNTECRYGNLAKARKELPEVAAELEMSESDIVILKETREEVSNG